MKIKVRKIKLPYEFEPRDFQLDALKAYFVDDIKRFCMVIHRRGGKTKLALNFLIAAAFKRVGVYYHLFPEIAQARKVIWDGIDSNGKRYLDHIPEELIEKPNATKMAVYLKNGSIIQISGSDRYDSLMGSNPAGIIFDEYSLQNPLAWHYLSPIIRQNGGFAFFIYTPRGHNHGYDLYNTTKKDNTWFVKKLSVLDTKNNDNSRIITDEDIEEDRKDGIPEEIIQQEYFVSFEAGNVGSIYSKQLENLDDNHIFDFEIDKSLPVFTSFDLGMNDSTVIWFMQVKNNKFYFFHCHEIFNEGIESWVRYINNFALHYKIRYKEHFAPFDINTKEMGTGKMRWEMALSFGLRFRKVPSISKQDGIMAVRLYLPDCHFHKTNCEHGLYALRSYRREYNEKKKCYSNNPLHDWSSDFADSFRYMIVAYQSFYSNEDQKRRFEKAINFGRLV